MESGMTLAMPSKIRHLFGSLLNSILFKTGSKEIISQRICEFLLSPDGAEKEEDDDKKDDEDVQEEEEEEEEEGEEEEEREEEKPKQKRGRNAREEKVSKTGRPRRSTAGRGKDLSSYVEYYTSEESGQEENPRAKKTKRRQNDSDSGSDVIIQNQISTRLILNVKLHF